MEEGIKAVLLDKRQYEIFASGKPIWVNINGHTEPMGLNGKVEVRCEPLDVGGLAKILDVQDNKIGIIKTGPV